MKKTMSIVNTSYGICVYDTNSVDVPYEPYVVSREIRDDLDKSVDMMTNRIIPDCQFIPDFEISGVTMKKIVRFFILYCLEKDGIVTISKLRHMACDINFILNGENPSSKSVIDFLTDYANDGANILCKEALNEFEHYDEQFLTLCMSNVRLCLLDAEHFGF